ncbi:MAG: MBL fold metallo-hydrolase [Ruminococcaceae bacterium]|nr:MBL fold metallo-hydrolase [Oscillospiraceae bacterium]
MKLLYFFDEYIKPRVSRGLKFCNPTNSGILTERISCIRQNDVNIWFYNKNGTVIAFDSGHLNFPGLDAEFAKIKVDPLRIEYLFLTHADVDHAGGVDISGNNIFPNARIHVGKEEEQYLKGEMHRITKLKFIKIKNCVRLKEGYRLIEDGEIFWIDKIKVEAIHVPGHTLGHYCYLIDEKVLISGDCLAINQNGGYAFFDFFTQFPEMNKKSLERLEKLLSDKNIESVCSGHSGFRTDIEKLFAFREQSATFSRSNPFDKEAPRDFTKY